MASNESPEGVTPSEARAARASTSLSTNGVGEARQADTVLPEAVEGRAKQDRPVPERRCILTGEHGPRAALIRLALSPDGRVLPDIRAKAPGRGAWIGVDKATLQAALVKGRLKGALARAFKTAVEVPADLADQIETALRRAALDRLGLEAKAGTLVTGSDRIADAARKGTLQLLVHAGDAAADGVRKLDQALRVGLGEEGSGTRGLVIPATRAILSMALGRENVVHIGLVAPAAAARVSDALGRWRGFLGRDWTTGPCDDRSQGASAHKN